jgi:uncharacterized membrane protein
MSKKEFLELLRGSLKGEVSKEIIEQNIRYYGNYISSTSESEEEKIIEVLGDPRLIAKTIIETEKASKQKAKSSYQQEYNNNTYSKNEENERNNRPKNQSVLFSNFKWYHKAVFYAVIALIIIIIVTIIISVAKLLIIFAVPILLMLLVLALFRKR